MSIYGAEYLLFLLVLMAMSFISPLSWYLYNIANASASSTSLPMSVSKITGAGVLPVVILLGFAEAIISVAMAIKTITIFQRLFLSRFIERYLIVRYETSKLRRFNYI